MTQFQEVVVCLILLIGLPVIVGIFGLLAGLTGAALVGMVIGTIVIVGFGLGAAWLMFEA